MVKNPPVTETIGLNRLRWFGHVQRMEGNRIPPKNIIYEFRNNNWRCRPRNKWQDKVREDGRLVGREGWKERVHNREEWKKILRMARKSRILHMPTEWMNESPTLNEDTADSM